jgi:hypothetical protein
MNLSHTYPTPAGCRIRSGGTSDSRNATQEHTGAVVGSRGRGAAKSTVNINPVDSVDSVLNPFFLDLVLTSP